MPEHSYYIRYDPWGSGKYKGVVLDRGNLQGGNGGEEGQDDGTAAAAAAPVAVPSLGGVNRNANGNAWAVPTTVRRTIACALKMIVIYVHARTHVRDASLLHYILTFEKVLEPRKNPRAFECPERPIGCAYLSQGR